MEHKNDNLVRDYDAVLDAKYGKPGTPERQQFEEEAYAFYSGQALRSIRRSEHVTQSELAQRVGTSKSYISKIESGEINPSIAAYNRLVSALGFQIQLTKAKVLLPAD